MITFDEIQLNRFVKRYYALLQKIECKTCESDWIKQQVNKSPLDMDIDTIKEYCLKFEKILNPKNPETETARKKVIEEIVSWLAIYNMEKDANLAKIIAVSESGYRLFDEIPANKLREICRSFRKKRQEFLSVEKVIADSSRQNSNSGLLSSINQK